ncbi:MAG: 1-acyl-sn-glycerol-3-phosphate acyltransferase [Gammaproteobacteria bacterium]|nr:1-acyl-sn-glycerol-3-phosphate acyltransferase [Gammaproteobacteria bacterium]MDH5801817.1 1-acyl-sn-glycerol-3-phosphate acyltransferase [Gammaproteobacteria bacterium]
MITSVSLWLALSLVAGILGAVGTRHLLRILDANKSADWNLPWLNCVIGLICLFCRYYHRFQGPNLPLPETGGAIVAANHVSGLDALILISASPRPLRFLIAREQYERFGLTWLLRAAGCIPVERSGRPELAFRQALRVLQQGEVVALFPHGTIQLDHHPRKRLKGGVAKLALLSKSPVFPVRLDGIRGQGHTVLAIPVRSRVKIKTGAPLDLDDNSHQQVFLEQLAQFIENRDNSVVAT